MQSCSYKIRYDHERLHDLTYECPENALSSGSLCKFHDSGYALAHPEEIMESLHQMINQKVDDVTQLLCIGFNIPTDLHINFLFFKNHVYFGHATFHDVVDLSWSNFDEKSTADFNNATFKKRATFSSATFNNEANFSSVIFNGGIQFKHATFDNEATFILSTFNSEASFHYTNFKSANFHSSKFNSEVNFSAVFL